MITTRLTLWFLSPLCLSWLAQSFPYLFNTHHCSLVLLSFIFEIIKSLPNFFLTCPPSKPSHVLFLSLYQIHVLFHLIFVTYIDVYDCTYIFLNLISVCINLLTCMFSGMAIWCWMTNQWSEPVCIISCFSLSCFLANAWSITNDYLQQIYCIFRGAHLWFNKLA